MIRHVYVFFTLLIFASPSLAATGEEGNYIDHTVSCRVATREYDKEIQGQPRSSKMMQAVGNMIGVATATSLFMKENKHKDVLGKLNDPDKLKIIVDSVIDVCRVPEMRDERVSLAMDAFIQAWIKEGQARPTDGRWYDYAPDCKFYLDAFLISRFRGEDLAGPKDMHVLAGQIFGFISHYNGESNNGIEDVLPLLGKGDDQPFRAVAEACQVNPQRRMLGNLLHLIREAEAAKKR